MEAFFSGTFMSLTFLLFLVLLRKKYNVPIKLMFLIYILFTITGTFGASLGAYISGLSWTGKRLHMLMAVDAISLTFFCKFFKKDENHFGDYLAVPLVMVCAAAKLGCNIFGCCSGRTLFESSEGVVVRFPSQIVELTVWILLAIWLHYIQKKTSIEGLLLPVALMWFSFFRFLVDFMRGGEIERTIKIFGLPIGSFWSFVVLIVGVGYLIYYFKRLYGRAPSFSETVRTIFGKKPINE